MMPNKTNYLNYLDCARSHCDRVNANDDDSTHFSLFEWLGNVGKRHTKAQLETQRDTWNREREREMMMHQSQIQTATTHTISEISAKQFQCCSWSSHEMIHMPQRQSSWVVCSVVSEWIVFAVGVVCTWRRRRRAEREAGKEAQWRSQLIIRDIDYALMNYNYTINYS